MSDCSFSNKLKSRCIETKEWLELHDEHYLILARLTTEPFPHPSGKWGYGKI